MKVRFIQSVSTLAESFGVNQEAELSDLLAGQWVAAGYCEAVEPALVETVEPVQVAPLSRKQRRSPAPVEADLM
jgi:hypothetical protein